MNEPGSPQRATPSDVVRDALFDALLAEAAGGASPPDVAEAVTHAVQRARRQRRVGLLAGAALGAAAALWVAVALGLCRSHPIRLVAWQVAAGCLECRTGASTSAARAGERALWPTAPGDRLRTCPDSAAAADIATLGRLHMREGTEIEVENMEWKSFGGGVALGAVTVAVVVGAIRWSGGASSVEARAGESLELRSDGAQATAARLTELQERLAATQQELKEANARAADLATQAARTVAANQEVAAAQAAATAEAPRLEHPFTYQGLEEALAAVDWDVTGTCMRDLNAKLEAVMAAVAKGEQPPMEALAEIQRLNSELIKQTGLLMKAHVPGTGPNGVFTHPVVAANQLHATLAKAGMPLSSAQEDAMRRLSAEIAGADDARRGALSEDGFQLEAVLGETGLKDRFYRDARALLTPQQESLLFPEHLAGRTESMFDSGLVWNQFANRVEAKGRTDFGEHVATAVVDRLGLGAELGAQARAAVTAWAGRLPDGLFGRGPRAWNAANMREAAQQQLELMREIDRLPLSAEQKRKLRGAGVLFLPVTR